ncbi:serine hydrolase [Virgibacillus byunsanensis]|uniref:serine-type D-Ala-D-Ala carboxypeptidase n=1 Tax=Virgibacillus byunsanensis TaxID=570945 RepID=A0ABW3LTV8_9BACI
MRHRFQKNVALLLVFLISLTTFVTQPISVEAAELDIQAESAILVDAETGKILFSKNPDIALPPASMTKMMTEYLVWEAIEEGQISWDTTTQISDYPYSISADNSFSGVGLRQNKDYTVEELYEAMAINSDNATTIALAELIAGSEGDFVKLMNEKGEEMGLPDFKFVNSTGLANESLGENYPEGTEPDANNLLSARSSALLAFHLVNDFPDALDISSVPETIFDEQNIRNWNYMLPHDAEYLQQYHYEGVDGLKTGYTDLAGYCFTGTALKDGKRLISVVMKTESEDARFKQTARLLDYGYSQFETKELFPADYQLEDESSLPVAKGKEDVVEIATSDAFNIPIKQGEEEQYSMKYTIDEGKLNKDGELTAPIEQGEKIGTAELVYDGEIDYGYIFGEANKTVDLVTKDGVEKSNWFMLTLGAIGDFFSNIFSTVVDTVKGWF